MCEAPTSSPKADESGQEDAQGKINFNEEMEEEEEGNVVAWKIAAGSRGGRLWPTTGRSKRERCVGKRRFVQDLETADWVGSSGSQRCC